ncbi:MAG: hypothetical protein AB7V14_02670 [Kiritimatiellia bacterium]
MRGPVPPTLGRNTAAFSHGLLAGVVFFLIHAALVVHHVYFCASKRGTVDAPNPPAFFEPAPLRQEDHSYALNRWDALLYESIARHGYQPPTDVLLPWFPGYPILVKGVALATGLPIPSTLTLLSAVATLGFWLLLWSPRMRSALGSKTLSMAGILVLIWPGAFFWFAGMTEPWVAFLMLAAIVAWLSNRRAAAMVLCGLAASVKQVFALVGCILVLLRWRKERPRPIPVFLWLITTWSGLLAYAFYCAVFHGSPLAFAQAGYPVYGRVMTLRALFDLPNFARHAWTLNGGTAIAVYGLALAAAAVWLVRQRGRIAWREMAKGEIPLSVFFWTVGGACMALYIAFDAYGFSPFRFTNFLRYQTTNVAHFLLAAYVLRQVRTRTLCLLLIPLAAVGLYWQNELAVRYWNWWWVA